MAIYFDKAALTSPVYDYLGMPQEVAIYLFNSPTKLPQAAQQVLQLQLAGLRGFMQCRIDKYT